MEAQDLNNNEFEIFVDVLISKLIVLKNDKARFVSSFNPKQDFVAASLSLLTKSFANPNQMRFLLKTELEILALENTVESLPSSQHEELI
jgi:hypothetical protein